MSKNIYRVNKKSDLDEIMKNNFLKPICIIFVSKSMDKKLYDDVATTIKSMSKQLTYSMILIIDFDNFIDNMNFFTAIKENVPHFIAYFKGKQLANCNDKDNFIPLIVGLMDQIHSSYVTRLMNAFNQQTEKTNLEQSNKVENSDDKQPKLPKQTEETDINQIAQPNTQPNTQANTQPNTQANTQPNTQSNTLHNVEDKPETKSSKSSKNKKTVKQQTESSTSSSEEEDEDEDEADEDEDEDEEEEVNVKPNKDIVQDDNTTENIRLKKEKLKELKKLKEMLNK